MLGEGTANDHGGFSGREAQAEQDEKEGGYCSEEGWHCGEEDWHGAGTVIYNLSGWEAEANKMSIL